MTRSSKSALAPALVAALAFARVALGVATRPPPAPPPERIHEEQPARLSDEARAVLGDLTPGRAVGDFQVTDVYGPVQGSLSVVLVRDDVTIEARVVRRGSAEGRPLVIREPWELLYTPIGEARLGPEEVRPILEELSKHLDVSAEIPLGM